MAFLPFPAHARRRILHLQVLVLLPLFLSALCVAQPGTSEATLVGEIRVSRGGSLPTNVMVVLKTRGAQAAVTYADGEGKFSFEGLLANVYHVVIQEETFQPFDVAVNVNPNVQHITYVYPELVPVEDQSKPAKNSDMKGGNPAMVHPSTLSSRYPKDARKHYERASQLQAEGKQRAAIDEYRKALAVAPDMYFARNNLGSLYLQDQQFENAEMQFRVVIEKNRADANAYFNLANVCLLLKRFDEAINFIQQGMTREPQSAFGHFLMGSVMMQKGKREWLRIHGRGVHHYYVQTLWGFVQKRRRATVHFLNVRSEVKVSWMKEKPPIPCGNRRLCSCGGGVMNLIGQTGLPSSGMQFGLMWHRGVSAETRVLVREAPPFLSR